MDKGLLFQFMRVKFREAGFTPAEVELHMQSFTERYQDKSDEEIEADIRRRGGPTRVAAATIERRNTVLMADADYRAFVESAKARSNAQNPAVQDAPVQDVAAADAPTQNEPILPVQTDKETTVEGSGAVADGDDDPLAAWFSAAEKEEQQDTLPPLFSGAEQNASAAPDGEEASATAEIPAVRPAAQTVHSIPLFGGESAQTAAKPSEKTADRPAENAPKMRPIPQSGAPKPVSDAAQGQTRIVPIPTEQKSAPVQQRMSAAPSGNVGQARSVNQYQQEQRAIWGTGSEIRDPLGNAHNTSNARSAQRPAQQTEKKQKIEYADRGTVTRLQEKTYWGEGSEEGVKRFRIVMAIAIPIMTVLLLAYAAIALGLIVFMVILMAAFVLGLVAWVAVGSLVALVAVIYGISQLFIVVPVGMFELGLGVAAIGITMFVGILMYNIAVRLLPFLMRQFIRFQGVLRGFIQDLYYYVKGECYRR